MYLKLDIRSKIILLIFANIIIFKNISVFEHFVLASIFTFLVIIMYDFTRAIRLYLIYIVFFIYELYFSKNILLEIIDNFLLFNSIIFKTMYFPICSGIILIGSSKVSELITFLRVLKIPKSVIIVIAVIFRFFPVLLSDYKNIKNSLKMKGIGGTRFYYLNKPLKFIEYIFVPYVIISSNIANELTVSCLCRGINNKNKATSIQVLKFTFVDYIFLIMVAIAYLFFVY